MRTPVRRALIAAVLSLAMGSWAWAQTTRMTLDPAPNAGASDLEKALSRYLGQDDFVSATYLGGGWRSGRQIPFAAAAPAAALESAVSDRREVVDSDIFNAGPQGSKILLLLNNYRGLTVLDFERGADNPRLIGRVPATGNYPRAMYADWTHKKAVVIEDWQRDQWDAGARILVYDLADLRAPRVIQSVPVGGLVSDSRLVGDVLYVVGQKMVEGPWWSREPEPRSYAKSFKVTKDSVEVIQEQELQHTADYRENMGIQEVRDANGQYRYYITAITKNREEQNWWTSRSFVEVLDITSAQGEIRPVMTVRVRGDIRKRSWVAIHGGSLIATSNYRTDETNWQAPFRVAVETFRFPGSDPRVIDETELNFRRLGVQRRLGASATQDSDAYDQLVSSGEYQLRQVFVKTASGHLMKVLPDFKTLDFGDSTGLSASVQDVRYVTDRTGKVRAHVFWVPVNMIDPLDIVDVTDTSVRPVHQSRLQFEGWITRSFNIDHNGRRFVVGLGYVVPPVDNPNNNRFAQAKIFEIIERGGRWVGVERNELTLPRVQWSNFDGQDKYVSMRFDAASGKGSLFFEAFNWSQTGYQSGGQTVEFDLNQPEGDGALRAGAFVEGDEGWLRRVFVHPNLDVMMTFSDLELGVFARGQGSADKVVEASTRMELARNILAYHDWPGQNLGLQIVQRGGYARGRVEFRLVPGDMADAEGPAVLATHAVSGNLKDYLFDTATGELLVLTYTSDFETHHEGRSWTMREKYVAQRLKLSREKGSEPIGAAVTFENSQTTNPDAQPAPEGETAWSSQLRGLVSLRPGTWAFTDGFNQVWTLSTNQGALTAEKVELRTPALPGATSFELSQVSGKLILSAMQELPATESEPKRAYRRNYFALVNPTGRTWTSGPLVNIPGTVSGLVRDGDNVLGVLSREDRLVDFESGLTEPALYLTWLGTVSNGMRKAELRALMNIGSVMNLVQISPSQWSFVESRASEFGGWNWGRSSRDSSQGVILGLLEVDLRERTLHRTVRAVNVSVNYSPRILGVFDDATRPGHKIFIVSSSTQLQALRVNPATKTVEPLVIEALNTFVEPGAPAATTVWNLPRYLSGERSLSLTDNRLRLVLGEFGVIEGILGEIAKDTPDQTEAPAPQRPN